MDVSILIFLSSGLFLGWSLGANDAANVFGTAVGSRMVRFATAALLCSVFVLLGAVVSGAGAAHGLGELGAVNAIAGAFMVALSAALTVYWMTKAGLPVSTTQAIVGAIVGWNLFSGSLTDFGTLTKIASTWVACPVLGAIFGASIYLLTKLAVRWTKPHLLRQDAATRIGLIVAGILGAYSLGANNIGNVMGVFVESSPFTNFSVGGLFTITGTQQLFLLGAVAIGVGVFTYSKRVMMTVGRGLIQLTPLGAFVVVVSHSIVLLLFSSVALEHALLSAGLPAFPLIPVSSSQAVVGAVLGVAMTKGMAGMRNLRWRVLGGIALGWVLTPVIAAVITFFALFFLQNVFNQPVHREVHYVLSDEVLAHLRAEGIDAAPFAALRGEDFVSAAAFRQALREDAALDYDTERRVITAAEVKALSIEPRALATLDPEWIGAARMAALRTLEGKTYGHEWQLAEALATASDAWQRRAATRFNRAYNAEIDQRLDLVYRTFDTARSPPLGAKPRVR